MNPSDPAQAWAFARDWIAAWNARDLPRVLAHYAEDFSMSSPYIVQIVGGIGVLQGKAAVADYWRRALERMPDLRFELLDVLASTHSLVLYYRNQAGRLTAECLIFGADGKVIQGIAHYSTEKTA